VISAAVALATTAIVTMVRSGERDSAGAQVLRAIAEGPQPARYRFEVAPDAAGLQACFSARRRVSGVVDRLAGRAGLVVEPVGLAVVVSDGAAFVHQDVLAGWAIPTEWIMVSAPLDEPARAALTTALGPDLASLVLAFSLPETPTDIADAALSAMRSAAILRPEPGDEPGGQRIRVDIDAAELTTVSSKSDDEADGGELTLVFEIDPAGQIVAVSARLENPASAQTDEVFGYRTTYEPDAALPVPALPDDSDVTPLNVIAIPDSPRPPDLACTIGP